MCFHKIFCLCSWECGFPVVLRTKNHCSGCAYKRNRLRDRGWRKQRQRDRKRQTGNNSNSCHNLPRGSNSKDNILRKMFLPGDVQRISPLHSSGNHNPTPLGKHGWGELGQREHSPNSRWEVLTSPSDCRGHSHPRLTSFPIPRLPGHPSAHCHPPSPHPRLCTQAVQNSDTRAHRRVHSREFQTSSPKPLNLLF